MQAMMVDWDSGVGLEGKEGRLEMRVERVRREGQRSASSPLLPNGKCQDLYGLSSGRERIPMTSVSQLMGKENRILPPEWGHNVPGQPVFFLSLCSGFLGSPLGPKLLGAGAGLPADAR